MHTYDVRAWGRAVAGGTQDLIGCRCSDTVLWLWFPLQTGMAEQVTAVETVDGWCRCSINRDWTRTGRARLLTCKANVRENWSNNQWTYKHYKAHTRKTKASVTWYSVLGVWQCCVLFSGSESGERPLCWDNLEVNVGRPCRAEKRASSRLADRRCSWEP